MFQKYFPLLLTLAGALAPVFSPAVQGFYSQHPLAVATVGGVWASIKWLLPSPISEGK